MGITLQRSSLLLGGFAVLAIATVVAGCATTVRIQARFPAQVPAAAALRKTAVADFYGPEGERFAYGLETMLGSTEFDGRPYFTLVDSGHRGAGSEARAAAFYGRSVGAQGVYFGQVQTADMHDDRYVNEDSRCIDTNDKGKCIRSEKVRVPCIHRVFQMDVMPSLVSVATGQVVYAARKSATRDTSWCRGDQRQMGDEDLVRGAQEQILADIRRDVAPYNTVLQAVLIEKHDGLSEEQARLFDAAVSAAGKGDMGEACRLWSGVNRSSPSHPWTAYDLGVCAEANGNFAGALSWYKRARALASQPDGTVTDAIARAQSLFDAQSALSRKQRR